MIGSGLKNTVPAVGSIWPGSKKAYPAAKCRINIKDKEWHEIQKIWKKGEVTGRLQKLCKVLFPSGYKNHMDIELSEDLQYYKESFILGLTVKQAIFSILALGTGTAIVFAPV